ncbi:hypothetical protein CGMCC3_g12875 [Colletotrichum fructicola]|nr:uncharacterized protein CGMCC3_g12875 [Colletotrichum fructicola]KAE9570926.1 hypothetical protein CGMCC3_g12875 [Colletotrichum fructicola]
MAFEYQNLQSFDEPTQDPGDTSLSPALQFEQNRTRRMASTRRLVTCPWLATGLASVPIVCRDLLIWSVLARFGLGVVLLHRSTTRSIAPGAQLVYSYLSNAPRRRKR